MSGTFYQYVFALKVYKGNLIAGGYFTNSGGILTNGIASWDGTNWSSLNGGLFEPGNVCGTHTLCLYGADLVVGGLFSSAGSISNTNNIAKWNNSTQGISNLNVSDDIQLISSSPNPFSNSCQIKYSIFKDAQVKITLQAISGEELIAIVNTYLQAGTYFVNLVDENLAPGYYFLKLSIANKSKNSKLIKIN